MTPDDSRIKEDKKKKKVERRKKWEKAMRGVGRVHSV
jgi:hypothetical protein